MLSWKDVFRLVVALALLGTAVAIFMDLMRDFATGLSK